MPEITTAREINRRLKCRRITKVLLRPFNNGDGATNHDPVIILDDGTTITFVAEEGERLGVTLCVHPPKEAPDA